MLKTAECVSPKHPDKLCDRISDAVLDAYLKEDPKSRVAVETVGSHGKILVTGSEGLLGSELIKYLNEIKQNYIKFSSKELDLTDLKKLDLYFKKNKPKFVIHAANRVYGIGGNFKKKFDMINENLIINANLLKVCSKYQIKKIVFISSSAIYSEKLKKKN